MILNDTSVTLNGLYQDLFFLGKFTSATFSTGDLNRIINKYYKLLQQDLRAVNEDFFMISAVTTLNVDSLSNGTYLYPIDYEKVKSFWVALNPANTSSPLYTEFTRCLVIDANSVVDPSYAFANPTVINFGTYFKLLPQLTNPSSGPALYPVTNGMKIYYIQRQADLVNPTDIPNIFWGYHDAIVWGSLIDIAQRLGKGNLEDKALERFTTRRAEMKADASGRILDISNSVVEGQTNQGGWQFPFGNGTQL